MKQYLQMCKDSMDNGEIKGRTGVGTKDFGYQARYNLEEGFPINYERVYLRAIITIIMVY